MANALEQLDAHLANLLSGWNIYTTVIIIVLTTCILYPLFFARDADTHPLLLARQASATPIRFPGESATYRSLEVPQGYPLRSGLNVLDPDAPKWTTGKDGDIRDIWREALRGGSSLLTIHGTSSIVEHDLVSITRQINVIGKHLKERGSKKVAIYLPNSVEFLTAVFGEYSIWQSALFQTDPLQPAPFTASRPYYFPTTNRTMTYSSCCAVLKQMLWLPVPALFPCKA